jgi:hypothetical protein
MSAERATSVVNLDFEKVFEQFREADGSVLVPFADPQFGFPDPNEHASIVEISYLLQAVLDGGPKFRVLALGAAPGEQAIRAERAHKRIFPDGDCRSISVEADLGHVKMIQDWLKKHSCNLMNHAIIFGSVTAEDGWSYFPVVEENDWGAAVTSFAKDLDGDLDKNRTPSPTRPTLQVIPAFSLHWLIKRAGKVDFLHCDIQGGERYIFGPTMQTLNDDVRMVCISVHATVIDRELKATFAAHGWECLEAVDGVYKYPPSGEECHKDGQLLFRNPKFGTRSRGLLSTWLDRLRSRA